jgi:homoserine kinase
MRSRSMLVKAPATVGSFAGAMNCAAVALNALLNVKVTPRADGRVGIRYFGENGDRVPRDRSNLVVRAMEAALHLKSFEFTGADFEIYSSIPVGVGLGSSTAAVWAGLVAADRLYSLGLDEKTLFDLARIYEARSDNLLAAWHGGFVACFGERASTLRRSFVPRDFVLSVVAPELPRGSACRSTAAMPSPKNHNYARAESLADLFSPSHKAREPQLDATLPIASSEAVPGLEDALNIRTEDALGVFVCGSGPAVGILTRQSSPETVRAVRQCFREFGIASTFGTFRPSNLGAREWNATSPEVFLPPARRREVHAAPVLA